MRHIIISALVVVALSIPGESQAGFIVEGSVGKGDSLKPSAGDAGPTNIMIAPGWALGEMLRLELGVVANLGDVGPFDLELRPTVVLDPPVLPIYFRVFLNTIQLLHDTETGYGAAIGYGFSLAGVDLFAEVDLIVPKAPFDFVTLEGRLGAYLSF